MYCELALVTLVSVIESVKPPRLRKVLYKCKASCQHSFHSQYTFYSQNKHLHAMCMMNDRRTNVTTSLSQGTIFLFHYYSCLEWRLRYYILMRLVFDMWIDTLNIARGISEAVRGILKVLILIFDQHEWRLCIIKVSIYIPQKTMKVIFY